MLKEGAVNVTEADVLLATVAVPTVGAVDTDLAPEALAPRIGIVVFYLILTLPIVDLVRT